MRLNKKVLFRIALVALIVAVLGCVYFFARPHAPEDTFSDTRGIITYSSKKYGFEMKYPKEMGFEEDVSSITDKFPNSGAPNLTLYIPPQTEDGFEASIFVNIFRCDPSFKNLFSNSVGATTTVLGSNTFVKIPEAAGGQTYLTQKDSTCYYFAILSNTWNKKSVSLTKTTESILSTFSTLQSI